MSTADPPAFDPAAYKRATREQWQEAAEAWHRWGPTIEDWLGEATDAMLDIAGVQAGSHVLDVAAGAGGQTLAAARRAGPDGSVLATDIAPKILEFAEREAQRVGLTNVSTKVLDGESLDVEPGTFDAVISRLGFIYFPDRQTSLKQMHQALKPGGKLAGIVYSTPQKNAFFSIPVAIIRRLAQLPAPAPGQPGPFSLGAEGAIEDAFEQAGFHDIEVRYVPSPVRLSSAAECVQFERESFGALGEMLAELDEAAREEAWEEIARELAQFEDQNSFDGPCELIVAAGTK